LIATARSLPDSTVAYLQRSYLQVLQPLASEVQPRSPSAQLSCVQRTLLHVAPVPQVTSHAQDAPQRTLLHDSLPLQPTLHGPEPQVTP